MTTPSSEPRIPTISLLPVADGEHRWVALLLKTSAPLLAGQLDHVFRQLALVDALDGLQCILQPPSDGIDALTEPVPADSLLWLVAAGGDPAPDLTRMTDRGMRVLAAGATRPRAGLAGFMVPAEHADAAMASWAGAAGLGVVTGVDDLARFAECRRAGYLWLEGNYALRPAGGRLPQGTARQVLALKLLGLLARDADIHEIDGVIRQDAHLSYQLIKLVNSVAYSLDARISSFSQAITLLGRRQLQRWLQLLLYAHPEGAALNPLLPRAALRAALMDGLCQGLGCIAKDHAYMVGMFSLLDRLMGMPMARVLKPLNLAETVAEALLQRRGQLGQMLEIVEAAEQVEPDALASRLDAAGITTAAWAQALVAAYRWTITIEREAR